MKQCQRHWNPQNPRDLHRISLLEASPPTSPQPSQWDSKQPPTAPKATLFFLLSVQDQIMWKMNHGTVRETTWPPQQNHTRQIDIIRQRPWVIFLCKYFTRLPFFLPPSLLLFSVLSSESICFSLLAQTNLRVWRLLWWVGLGRAESGWAGSGHFIFWPGLRGECLRARGVVWESGRGWRG